MNRPNINQSVYSSLFKDVEQIISLLKKHDLMIIYVDNMWTVSTHKPLLRSRNTNLSAAILQVTGKLLARL